jgi:metal-sulfur cluster biosynthetic enzyme
LQTWLDQWRVKVNNTKSTQITFTTTHIDCPQTTIYNMPIPIRREVKYLCLRFDRRLTWQAHIKAKRQQLNLRVKKYYWLIGKNSELSIENKLLLYKIILKPVWTYGTELWGSSKHQNIAGFPIKNFETEHRCPMVYQQPNIAY